MAQDNLLQQVIVHICSCLAVPLSTCIFLAGGSRSSDGLHQSHLRTVSLLRMLHSPQACAMNAG